MKPVILRPGVGDNRPTATLYYGQDTRETLRTLPEASVQTVCTSPPYFGLRDYGTGDKQIGLEPTPEEFVVALVEVFREVKRVLRDDGTLWVNLGDSYAGGGGFSPNSPSNLNGSKQVTSKGSIRGAIGVPNGLKPKDLIGIPWRVAFALQADGWYLRQDIVWAKPNPMPESVTDRCTKSHEYVFLFAHPDSGGKYYYDADAIREPHSEHALAALARGSRLPDKVCAPTGGHFAKAWNPQFKKGHSNYFDADGNCTVNPLGRNRRSVWSVPTAPYQGAHFATWPPELVRPMVLAGCPVEGTVLDPFSGSATTGMVALQEGRNYIGCDLNPDYLPLAERRVREEPAPVDTEAQDEGDALDLFSDG